MDSTDKKKIAERLKLFINNNFDGSTRALAKAIGLREQALYDYVNGVTKPGAKMQNRLRGVNCDIEWLMTGKDSTTSMQTKESNLRPVYASIPAGKGSITKAHSYLDAPPNVHDEGKGYWIKVKGDSMTPRFNDGDMIFVNPALEVRSGDIAVVYWNDHQDGAIKKVHIEKNNIVLTSLNSNHPPSIVPMKSVSAMARICYIKL